MCIVLREAAATHILHIFTYFIGNENFEFVNEPSCDSKVKLILKGAGGLHQDFLEIDFLVVSDRGE